MECLVCKSKNINVFLESSKSSMLSDGELILCPLVKYICENCNLVFNTEVDIDLKKHYEDNYKIYALETNDKEHIYVVDGNAVTRSEFYYEWILDLTKGYLDDKTKLLEIGCGKGDLLSKFSSEFDIYGIDMANSAVQLAQQKGLNVYQSSYEDLDENGCYDIIVSITVMEHVLKPHEFLIKQSQLLNKNGVIVLTVPIQDDLSYDVYMIDHLWHFHSNHIKLLAEQNNLFVLNYSIGYKVIKNCATFVLCKKEDVFHYTSYDDKKIDTFDQLFENMNGFINKHKEEKVFLYGNGEYSKFLQAYSDIGELKGLLIEDNLKYATDESITFEEFSKQYESENNYYVVLAMNESYHQNVIEKFVSNQFTNVLFYQPQSGKVFRGKENGI